VTVSRRRCETRALLTDLTRLIVDDERALLTGDERGADPDLTEPIILFDDRDLVGVEAAHEQIVARSRRRNLLWPRHDHVS